jgi:hypothetical protein
MTFLRGFSLIIAEQSAWPLVRVNVSLVGEFGELGPDDFVL